MIKIKNVLAFALSLSIAFTSSGFGGSIEEQEVSLAPSTETEVTFSVVDEAITDDYEIVFSSETGTAWLESEAFEESIEETAIAIEAGEVDSIYSVISTMVASDLEAGGFICDQGIAQTVENDNYTALGIYYLADDIRIFDDISLQAVGFVEIASDQETYYEPGNEESVIVVTPMDPNYSDEDPLYVCTYESEEIAGRHFIFHDTYVTYYQQTPMRVVYSVHENKPDYYDMNYGSLYDFDKKRYLIDDTLLDEYAHHSAVPLFSEQDYNSLERHLKQVSRDQEKNGYTVSEFKVVYISPESIQAYLDSEEEATFFGYSVSELTAVYGLGTTLQYTGKELVPAEMLSEGDEYNWKSFLTKIGTGAGIIIIGATLTSLTGGASFVCTLFTIISITATSSLLTGLGTLAVETASGLMNGKTIDESLKTATFKGLDAFANTFLIMSVVSSVGVVSGAIKPVACFASGTPVVTGKTGRGYSYTNIEKIHIGDTVLSYNESTDAIEWNEVTEIFKNEVYGEQVICFEGEDIFTTPEHPFFSPSRGGWIPANQLEIEDSVFCADGSTKTVEYNTYIQSNTPITVYNISVRKAHSYYVGNVSVLVHNKCESIASLRRAAVKEAWKREVEAVKKGISKYNWTPKEIRTLLSKGKIPGYEGHHIFTVRELRNTVNEHLISNHDNIVFLKRSDHIIVHLMRNFRNRTDFEALYRLLPWAEERVAQLLPLFL